MVSDESASARRSRRIKPAEIRVDFEMPLENADDFEAVFDVAKEEQIIAVRELRISLRNSGRGRPTVAFSAANAWHLARNLATKVSPTATLPVDFAT
jgi:hypothetical protein